ncbi:lysostaphin resistance A-like protein [Prescottella agglutinans]|uniref:CPBP family intramembrane glutamic endopeptidase n=1 Tax=Prescottella agglutinans TaxID=1644129 RepID=UPI003D98E401
MTTAPPVSPPATVHDDDSVRRLGLRWFLVLAFVASWVPWALVWVAGYSLDNVVVQLLTAAFVPALAAIVTRRWITREGFADAGLRPRLSEAWSSYLIAALLPVGVLAVALAAAAATGVWDVAGSHFGRNDLVFVAIAMVVPVVAAPLFWGEEFGWTAYLRDRLVPGRPIATTFATGLIWGVWHWPLPWVGYFGAGGSAADAVVAMLMWLPLSVLLEFVIGWLWSRSGSVWPPAILHGGSNLVVAVGLGRFADPGAPANAVTLLMCAAYLPVVACIVVASTVSRCRKSGAER